MVTPTRCRFALPAVVACERAPSRTGGHLQGVRPVRVGDRFADEVRRPVAVLADRHPRPADRGMAGMAATRSGHRHAEAAVRLHRDGGLAAGGCAPVVRDGQSEGEDGSRLHQRRDELRSTAPAFPNGHGQPSHLLPAEVDHRPVRVHRLPGKRRALACVHGLRRHGGNGRRLVALAAGQQKCCRNCCQPAGTLEKSATNQPMRNGQLMISSVGSGLLPFYRHLGRGGYKGGHF